MSFFCCLASYLCLPVWFCIYTHAQLRILKFQDSVSSCVKGQRFAHINEWRKSKRSVVLLRRQLIPSKHEKKGIFLWHYNLRNVKCFVGYNMKGVLFIPCNFYRSNNGRWNALCVLNAFIFNEKGKSVWKCEK